ncbi:MAG: hypothetical protein V3U62_07075 [Sedimenticolaceae bacterium]
MPSSFQYPGDTIRERKIGKPNMETALTWGGNKRRQKDVEARWTKK